MWGVRKVRLNCLAAKPCLAGQPHMWCLPPLQAHATCQVALCMALDSFLHLPPHKIQRILLADLQVTCSHRSVKGWNLARERERGGHQSLLLGGFPPPDSWFVLGKPLKLGETPPPPGSWEFWPEVSPSLDNPPCSQTSVKLHENSCGKRFHRHPFPDYEPAQTCD